MLFFSYEIALAQSHEEALFFSTQNYIGTARSSAMGNAFGALGADMTSIHINPAGLGLFRTFNMSFTLGLGMNEISTYYMGNKYVDKSGNFNLNSLGISSVGKKDIENDWRRINYSFSYNRTKKIKNSYQIMGFNNSSSMIEVFNDLAQGQLISELNSDTILRNISLYPPAFLLKRLIIRNYQKSPKELDQWLLVEHALVVL